MEGPLKRKVTSKLSYNDHSTNKSPSPYRPPSPLKSNVSASLSTATVRPRAKVNSSATPNNARAKVTRPLSAVSSSGTRAPTSIPRPASPTKSYMSASPTISSQRANAPRANLRPHTSHSTPGTPTTQYRSVESNESETRYGSLSVRQTGSPSLGLGLTNGSLSSNSIFTPSDEGSHSPDPPVKIKSKLTRVATKQAAESLSPSPSPAHPSSHLSGYARVRAPSISSSHSLSSTTTTSSTKPDYTLYPITSASAATDPHRYAPNRPPDSTSSYQPFPSPPRQNGLTKHHNRFPSNVDPAAIPLPPHSPPTSALSFSSRSSVSQSSVSYGESANSSASTSVSAHHSKSPSQGLDLRSTLDDLVNISGSSAGDDLLSPTEEGEDLSEERKARNEAKVNRKIADLEITNRSLLAINSSLEATKHRQAKEIRELRRKLRESRLILPPRTYRDVTSKETDHSDPEDDLAGEDEDEDEVPAENDETYMRIRMRMDEMIESAKAALITKPADFVDVKVSTKVLNEQEVRDWRDSGGGDNIGDLSLVLEIDEEERNERNPSAQGSRAPSRNGEVIANDKADDDSYEVTSEDEVEALTIPRNSVSPPPIVVTDSA